MTPDQVDPVILSAYRWLDFIGVVLMGIIGGTIARQKGYDIGGLRLYRHGLRPRGRHGS